MSGVRRNSFTRFVDVITDAIRRSPREYTQQNTADAFQRDHDAATRPTHISANGRAQPPVPNQPTSPKNKAEVEELLKDKKYKGSNSRVHFKGDRFEDSLETIGTPLAGKSVLRGNWTKEQVAVSKHFGHWLMSRPGFTPANHSSGHQHGAEIAHGRAQHAGGRTDILGAQPASWHSNVEDMAREEGMKDLHEKLKDKVRLKSTIYVQETGEHASTVVASRHKIYIQNDKGVWEKKFDRLQDGRRGDIDKDEAAALKNFISHLSSSSPNEELHAERSGKSKGIPSDSSFSKEPFFSRSRKNNDSLRLPYFTDMVSSDEDTFLDEEAKDYMEALLFEGYSYVPG